MRITILLDWMRTIASYVFMRTPYVNGMNLDNSGAAHDLALRVSFVRL